MVLLNGFIEANAVKSMCSGFHLCMQPITRRGFASATFRSSDLDRERAILSLLLKCHRSQFPTCFNFSLLYFELECPSKSQVLKAWILWVLEPGRGKLGYWENVPEGYSKTLTSFYLFVAVISQFMLGKCLKVMESCLILTMSLALKK